MITKERINRIETTLLLSTSLKGHQLSESFIAGRNDGIVAFAQALQAETDLPDDIDPEYEAMMADLVK